MKLKGKHRLYFYDYPAGNRAYGGGGWSFRAKHRPAPVLVIHESTNVELRGQSVFFDGRRKLKCTIVRCLDACTVREDYPLHRITRELLTRQSSTELEISAAPPESSTFGGIGHRAICAAA